ncbi:MAG: hypothetical protein ABEJ72_05955 [Candidatus Aenigmatarchaeota archaeon]
MPLKYLARMLSGNGRSRVDTIEERLRRLENDITRMMARMDVNRKDKSKQGTKENRSKKAGSVYTSEGWQVPDSGNGLRTVDFGQEWMLEFECPNCGNVSHRGIDHSHTRRGKGHTRYGIRLNCGNCGWQSDTLNIRALR